MLDNDVSNATKISLIVQSITGIIGLYGLSVPIAPKDFILKQVLGLEMFVQIIEFFFYLGFLYIANINTLTQKRYHDWFLSTPIMLFTTALYFYYVNNIEAFNGEDKNKKNYDILTFIKTHWKLILLFITFNFLMLLFGYLGEVGSMNKIMAFVLGTGALCGSFGVIYENFAKYSEKTRKFFWLMFTIWAFYGIAFLMPAVPKNVGYTVLDIFAKNFFGVFLAYTISTKNVT